MLRAAQQLSGRSAEPSTPINCGRAPEKAKPRIISIHKREDHLLKATVQLPLGPQLYNHRPLQPNSKPRVSEDHRNKAANHVNNVHSAIMLKFAHPPRVFKASLVCFRVSALSGSLGIPF